MPRFTRLSDIWNLIDSNLKSESRELRIHAESMLGKRSRGSTTELSLKELGCDQGLEHMYHENGCDYYLMYSDNIGGKIGTRPLGELLAEGKTVSIRNGEHGEELYLDNDSRELVPTNIVCFIVGKQGEETALFTWHPGYPLDPYTGKLHKNVGVKLHNG